MNNLKELMGIAGHATEAHGLHPILQSNWADAQSVLDDIGSACLALSTIGLDDLDYVKQAYFAAITKNEEWFDENYKPEMIYLAPRVDLYEVPGPCALTVQSADTPRCATVVVIFTDVDENGYGDWASAIGLVHNIFDDADAATNFLQQVRRAFGTQRAVIKQLDRLNNERHHGDSKVAPAF